MAKGKSFQIFVKAKVDKVVQEVSGTLALEYARQHFKARTTIGAFVARMQADGAWDLIKSLSIQDLTGKLAEPAAAAKKRGRPAGKGKKKKTKRGRMTKEDKAKLLQAVPVFLKKNPNSKAKDIASAVGLPTTKLAGPLRELIKSKKISKKGKKAGTTYSAGSGGKKPKKARSKGKAKKTSKKKRSKKKTAKKKAKK